MSNYVIQGSMSSRDVAGPRYPGDVAYGPAGNWWHIIDCGPKGYMPNKDAKIIASFPMDLDWEDDEPQPDVRAEYERLLKEAGWVQPVDEQPSPLNVVEMLDEDQSQDQPCVYGNRVDGHAVYCHNTLWLYAPRKCRRTWYTGGRVRDEDCKGYKPNPNYKPKEPK